MSDLFRHHGVNYKIISREEAVMTHDFPRVHRLKMSTAPSAKFVILMATDPCDEDRKFICEIEN